MYFKYIKWSTKIILCKINVFLYENLIVVKPIKLCINFYHLGLSNKYFFMYFDFQKEKKHLLHYNSFSVLLHHFMIPIIEYKENFIVSNPQIMQGVHFKHLYLFKKDNFLQKMCSSLRWCTIFWFWHIFLELKIGVWNYFISIIINETRIWCIFYVLLPKNWFHTIR